MRSNQYKPQTDTKPKPMTEDMRAVLEANNLGLSRMTKRLDERLEATAEPDEGAIG